VASLRRFSHDDIEKLRLMAHCGYTGKAIAKALGAASGPGEML
jgi:hypothetical protein